MSLPPATELPPAPAGAAPLALAYDELPPGSDVRREYGAGGTVTITAPAGEPSAAVRRAAAHRTGVSSAVVCGAALGVAAVLGFSLLDSVRRLDSGSRVLGAISFAVLCAGVFLLAWTTLYNARLQALTLARRQSAVLHAAAARLLVETAGPAGDQSLDLTATELYALDVIPGSLWATDESADSVACLRLTLRDGRVIRLMPGRHESELCWVAAAVRQAMEPPLPDR